MKMRKLLSILLAACLVLSLAACSGKDDKETKPADTKPAESVKEDDTEPVEEATEPAEEATEPVEEATEPAEEEATEPEEEAEADPTSTPRNETLYFDGQQWGAIPSWNPWSSNANNGTMSQAASSRELVYETMFMYNLTDGQLYPLLAESYEWNDDQTVLTVNFKDNAFFGDGSQVTAYDAEYYWTLSKDLDLPNYAGWQPYIEDVKAVEDLTLQITLVTNEDGVAANPLQGLAYICQTYVTSKAYLETVLERTGNDKDAFMNDTMEDFVASGPYKPYVSNEQKWVIVRDENYWGQAENMWGALPAPKYLAHNIYADNAAGNVAFSLGEVDMAQQFNEDIPTMMEENPNIAAYIDEAPYNLCTTMPTCWFNLEVPGLDQAVVRKAIALAVDYDQIVTAAMAGQCPSFAEVPRSVMNPTAGEQAMYDSEDPEIKALQWVGGTAEDIEAANAMLDEAGIVDTDGDGIREIDGANLHFTAECPAGWSDWNKSLEIVAAAGAQIGIEIETYFPEAAEFYEHFTNHDFEIGMWSVAGAGITSPWGRVRSMMSSEFVGNMNNWNGNYGWYSNERVDELISIIPNESDPEVLKAYYTELTKIYLTDVPSFSLMYRPEYFHNTNESVWSGFPALDDGDNIPPTVCMDGYGVAALYNLYLVEDYE